LTNTRSTKGGLDGEEVKDTDSHCSYGTDMTDQHPNFIQSYFHGTKCNLNIGDRIVPGNRANYGERKAKFVYASSNLNVAIWAAELALGDGPGNIYVVEPVGPIENDPNLTDKKFPGNPTNSFRARSGFTVVAEVTHWQGHPPKEIQAAREKVDLALKNGAPIIED
jgi:rifampin ADP-ribosyltransferase